MDQKNERILFLGVGEKRSARGKPTKASTWNRQTALVKGKYSSTK